MLVAANSFYPVAAGSRRRRHYRASRTTRPIWPPTPKRSCCANPIRNPDLRIIMTVTESFYRLVARRSAGISKLADLKGKRIMVPRMTSAHYYLVAMLRSAGLTRGRCHPGEPADVPRAR